MNAIPSVDPKSETVSKEPVAAEPASAAVDSATAEVVKKVAREFFRERAGRPE